VIRPAITGAVLLWAAVASAHKPSDSYLTLRHDGARLAGEWDIALRDLDDAIGVDDGDGAITWGELRARQDVIARYALARLAIDADGAACTSRPTGALVDRHSDGTYAVVRFAVDCPHPPRALGVRYGLFFDRDAQHRGVLHFSGAAGTRSVLFSVERRVQQFDVRAAGGWQSVAQFWRDGVWHIWEGTDHILFLLALLMPALLRRQDGTWRTIGLRDAFASTVQVVTAFTVAHSITLALAALGVMRLPSRLVEAGIAASVTVAALNNVYPLFADGRWRVAFGFGLLHGFGFASALADPSLPAPALLRALLGFNLGVETGQLAIVAVFLPIAYAVRRSWAYQRLILVFGSFAIAALAAGWLIERALDMRVF
jgi:hypothetical protein